MEQNNRGAKTALSKKAILYGALTDVLGSMGVGFVFGFGAGVITAMQGKSLEDFLTSPLFWIVATFIGISMTVLGGYVAARKGGNRFIAHALWTGFWVGVWGFFTSLLPLIIKLSSGGQFVGQDFVTIFSILTVIPLAGFGGYLASISKKK